MNLHAIESQVFVSRPLYSLDPIQIHEVDRMVGRSVGAGQYAFYIPFDGVIVVSPYPCSVLFAQSIGGTDEVSRPA